MFGGILSSVAEPEPPGAANFRMAPEPEQIFSAPGGAAPSLRWLRLHLFGKQIKPCFLFIKHEFRAIYKDNMTLKKVCINI